MSRYEIVRQIKDSKGVWFEDGYLGPWRCTDEPTVYDDFREALALIYEWAYTSEGVPRVRNKIGIYDHEDDEFYTQERCLEIGHALWRGYESN